ncbi:MAG TPA: AAA family ATPase, partial [Thermoanaerobaculia bacterium]
MSHRNSVHDLKSLVLSFHSLIGIETVEEDRVRSLLMEVATDLKLPFFEWSLTSGFNRVHGAMITGTQDALAALHHIAQIENTDAIFLLKDMARHLDNPNVSRALRELAQKLMS